MQMTEQISIENVKAFSDQRNEPRWLLKKRLDAFEAFPNIPLLEAPDSPIEKNYTKWEGFDFAPYTPLRSPQEISIHIPNLTSLTSQGLIVQTFSQALEQNEELLKSYLLTTCVKPMEKKYLAWHTAFLNQLLLIVVPENKKFTQPLRIQITSPHNHSSVLYSLLVIAEENTHLNISEEFNSPNSQTNSLYSDTAEFFLEPSSEISLSTVQYWSKNSWGFSSQRALVESNAHMSWHNGNFGSKLFKQFTDTELLGEKSQLHNYGYFLINGSQHYELVNTSWHKAPQTNAIAYNKGVLNNNAVSVYKGLIKVEAQARQVLSELSGHALLLGPNARANALPELVIDNNDVLTKHAASVSQLDEKQVFYLMSRGLSRSESEKIILDGLFDTFLERVPVSETVKFARSIIDTEYSHGLQR